MYLEKNINMKFLLTSYWMGYISAVLGWVISFLMPISQFLIIVLAFVVFDLISGTRASIARGEKITSRGFSRTVEKITLYFMAILGSHAITIVFVPLFQVAYVTAFAIALTEFKSNIENVETVTGVNIWNKLKGKFNSKEK